jgi:hypothetical protein
MLEPKFKYKINELLNGLPITEYRKAIALLPGILGIHKNTFIIYRNLLNVPESGDIPHGIVCDLERFFGLEPNGLQNYQSNITPLADLKNLTDTPGEGVAGKFGLVKA